MALNWNWFFAAYAQSFAALVGIVGAFLVSKLIDAETVARELRRDIERWENRFNELSRRMDVRYPGWVISQRIDWAREEVADEIRRTIERGHAVDQDGVFLDAVLHVSPYTDPEMLQGAINQWVGEIAEDVAGEEQEEEEGADPQNFMQQMAQQLAQNEIRGEFNVKEANLTLRVEREEDHLHDVFVESRTVIDNREDLERRVEDLRQRIQRFRPLILGAAILAIVGVIFPLSVLPSPDLPSFSFDLTYYLSLRGTMVALGTIGVLGFFLYLFYRTWQAEDQLDNLPEVFYDGPAMGDISEYFDQRERLNERADELAP